MLSSHGSALDSKPASLMLHVPALGAQGAFQL